MEQLFSAFGLDWRLLLIQALNFGLLLMVLMIFRPQGLLPVSRPAREDDESARGRPAVSTERIAPKVPDGASLDS